MNDGKEITPLNQDKRSEVEKVKLIMTPDNKKKAVAILQSNITERFKKKKQAGKPCSKCQGDAWMGLDHQDRVVGCRVCVDMVKAFNDWLDYCEGQPNLREMYKEHLDNRNLERELLKKGI